MGGLVNVRNYSSAGADDSSEKGFATLFRASAATAWVIPPFHPGKHDSFQLEVFTPYGLSRRELQVGAWKS